jgi:hypothetical protein
MQRRIFPDVDTSRSCDRDRKTVWGKLTVLDDEENINGVPDTDQGSESRVQVYGAKSEFSTSLSSSI